MRLTSQSSNLRCVGVVSGIEVLDHSPQRRATGIIDFNEPFVSVRRFLETVCKIPTSAANNKLVNVELLPMDDYGRIRIHLIIEHAKLWISFS
jgi:hypothetical protein